MQKRPSKKVFELCNAVWRRALDNVGDDPNPKARDFSVPERTVVLVWTVYGIVGNGGFDYLFSSDLPGDPGYRMALSAYRRIGSRVAARVFADALAFFPGTRVPKSYARRKAVFKKHPEEARDALDRRFYAAENEIVSRLANFIREKRLA